MALTNETLLRGKLSLGGSPAEGPEIRLAVHEHYKRFLEKQGDGLVDDGRRPYPNRFDYLDLLYAFGEDNLFKDVERTLYMQGDPESALRKMDECNRVYRGHPKWTYMRSKALSAVWSGRLDRGLVDQIKELRSNAVYWSQGQVFPGRSLECFDRDYPRRPFWNVRIGDRDHRKKIRF